MLLYMSSSKQVCQPYNFLLSSFLGHGGCFNSLIICVEIEQQVTEKLKLYPTALKLFFVLPVRSFLRGGPLNRWACLTTRLTIHVYKL